MEEADRNSNGMDLGGNQQILVRNLLGIYTKFPPQDGGILNSTMNFAKSTKFS